MKNTLIARAALIVMTLATAGAAPAAVAERHGQKKRLLVSFVDGLSKAGREQAAREMGLEVSEDIDSLGVAVLESAGDVEAEEFSRARAHPKVLSVEDDAYRNWLLDGAPALGDMERTLNAQAKAAASLARKESAPGSRADVPWGVARVDAPAAWPAGEGEGVRVAVVDTGIDCGHPDLRCLYKTGMNILSPGASAMDDNMHGTHVSGTIAGRGRSGPRGVAPKATLVPVKVLDARGGGRMSDIIKGIVWATDAGVDVINMSLGGPGQSLALERAVAKALSAGVTVVCAAGNSGPGPDTVGYPAAFPGVIAVAASDKNDRVAAFSSRGPEVSFLAPGVDILSTVPGGGMKVLSGTSMASPHVAGLAALAIECGAKGPVSVREAFENAATTLPGLKENDEGAGMIDAALLCR